MFSRLIYIIQGSQHVKLAMSYMYHSCLEILKKYPALSHYQVQPLQNLTPNNRETYYEFYMNMIITLQKIKHPIKYQQQSNSISWKINGHNSCERGSENAHAMAEYIRDNPNTGFCALRCDKMYIHFFDGETTVNVIIMSHWSCS